MKGKALIGRSWLAALGSALLAVAPLAAAAQTALTYYTAPTLVKRGANTSAVAGPGTVVVQVMVNKDGTFKVMRVIRSSNPRDNAAALEIAKSSTYKPASRGAAKLAAFYDFTLKFTGTGAAATSDAGSGAASGGRATYERMINAGNYAGAQSGLKSYVAGHPEDAGAEQDLGVADTFLSDYQDAAAAFENGGTVAPN